MIFELKPYAVGSRVYQVSREGRIFLDGRELNQRLIGRGYKAVSLGFGRKGTKNYYVHRLVAECYIPNPGSLPQVNHIDLDKQNNFASNLEWVDASGNMRHALALKKFNYNDRRGDKNVRAKLTSENARKIIASKASTKVLAARHSISESQIQRIRRGSNWKHLAT